MQLFAAWAWPCGPTTTKIQANSLEERPIAVARPSCKGPGTWGLVQPLLPGPGLPTPKICRPGPAGLEAQQLHWGLGWPKEVRPVWAVGLLQAGTGNIRGPAVVAGPWSGLNLAAWACCNSPDSYLGLATWGLGLGHVGLLL